MGMGSLDELGVFFESLIGRGVLEGFFWLKGFMSNVCNVLL